MARRTNAHSFAKRQKELKRMKKQQDKRLRKMVKKEDEEPGVGESAESPADGSEPEESAETVDGKTETSEPPSVEG